MGMIYKGEECRLKLIQWSKHSSPIKTIEEIEKRIMNIKKGQLTATTRSELHKLTGELEKLY